MMTIRTFAIGIAIAVSTMPVAAQQQNQSQPSGQQTIIIEPPRNIQEPFDVKKTHDEHITATEKEAGEAAKRQRMEPQAQPAPQLRHWTPTR